VTGGQTEHIKVMYVPSGNITTTTTSIIIIIIIKITDL
jgi:hypothetical protein